MPSVEYDGNRKGDRPHGPLALLLRLVARRPAGSRRLRRRWWSAFHLARRVATEDRAGVDVAEGSSVSPGADAGPFERGGAALSKRVDDRPWASHQFSSAW